jgi:hypothetical protein
MDDKVPKDNIKDFKDLYNMVKNWKVKDLLKVENQVIVREILKDLGRDEVIRGINGPPLGWGDLKYNIFIVLQAFIAGIIKKSDVINNPAYVNAIDKTIDAMKTSISHLSLPPEITDIIIENTTYNFSSKKPKRRSKKPKRRSKKPKRRSKKGSRSRRRSRSR